MFSSALTFFSQSLSSHPKKKPLLDEFKEGDLLFGLAGDYRNQLVNTFHLRGYAYSYASQLNWPTVGPVVKNSKDIPSLSSAQKRHYDLLLSLREYLIRPDGKPVSLQAKDPLESAAYRRACKILIRTANPNQRVHFELSGVDITRVCKKEKDDLGVTNSELRAAYRHMKQFGENPNLFFYTNGMPCHAPWIQKQNETLWQEYDHLRMKKKLRETEEKIEPNKEPVTGSLLTQGCRKRKLA